MFACLVNTNQNYRMDIKGIRRKRLKEWFSTKTLPEKEKSYLSQLINGKASFGEKAARRLERDYHMPIGYLDTDTNTGEVSQCIELSKRQKILLELFDELPDSEADELLKTLEEKKRYYNQLLEELSQKKSKKKA
ncbi:hypothetical protein [Photorhabdus caribbeanensis]|uniref:hypothetical protein n=1 Tax=Photorhabdus caribbeanensis TaxID=1004165 RepID=UPI0006969736